MGRLGKSPLAGNPLAASLATPQAKKGQRTTISLSVHEAELARDAAYHLRVTLVDFVETALREHVSRLEKERGEPFRPRPQHRRR